MINQLSYCSNRLEAFFWSPRLDDLMSACSTPDIIFNSADTLYTGFILLEGVALCLSPAPNIKFHQLFGPINDFASALFSLLSGCCSSIKITNKYIVDLTPYIKPSSIALLDDLRDGLCLFSQLFGLAHAIDRLYLHAACHKSNLLKTYRLQVDSPEGKKFYAASCRKQRLLMMISTVNILEKCLLIWGRHSGRNLSRPLVALACVAAVTPLYLSCRKESIIMDRYLKNSQEEGA